MKKVKYVFLAIMAVQIIWAIVWMASNFTVIPEFGDTAEYVGLSGDLVIDEYRPILFPLILKGLIAFENSTGIPYQCILYTIQIIFSFGVYYYAVSVVSPLIVKSREKISKGYKAFIAAYFVTIPMITFMNCTVLTDSLANSAFVLFLVPLVLAVCGEKLKIRDYIFLFLGLTIGALLRGDRLYEGLVIGILSLVVMIIRHRKKCIRPLICLLAVFAVFFVSVRGINAKTQTPGVHGRITTNLDFIILDRIVWPNMVENYDNFPEEVKEIIFMPEAEIFDENNNYVMYIIAPLIEERVGKENAGAVYRKMAKAILKNNGGKIAGQIAEDIVAVAFTPVSSLLNKFGLCEKNDSYNIMRMSQKTEDMTRAYDMYFLISFLVMLVTCIGIVIYKVKKGFRVFIKNTNYVLVPFTISSIVINLWFCIGDGAPPNDRYALIIYTTWMLFVLSIAEILGKIEILKKI